MVTNNQNKQEESKDNTAKRIILHKEGLEVIEKTLAER